MKYTPTSPDDKFSMEEIMVRVKRILDDCICLNGDVGKQSWVRIDHDDWMALEQWRRFMEERVEARNR